MNCDQRIETMNLQPSGGWRVSLVTVVIILVIQVWLAGMTVFIVRKIPAVSVEIHQPSGHVSHEQLWRALNNDDPVLGGIVDTWLIESLSFHPRVSLVHEFIKQDELDLLTSIARRSVDNAPKVATARERTGGTISPQGDDEMKLVKDIDNRISRLTLLHKHCNEPLIAYRYLVGQGDADHMDALDYDDPRMREAGGQRVVSIMIFLNDVTDGGAVRFDTGQFEVEPRAGDALYFWNASPNGLPDPASLYKSHPLKSGEKWIIMAYVRASSWSGPEDRD